MRQTLPNINMKHFFMNIFYIESFWPQKKHNITFLFSSILLKHSHNFDYLNQPLNMSMRVCYLDCLEAGLFLYLVIHRETLLHPLELLYFQLWPYWLSLALTKFKPFWRWCIALTITGFLDFVHCRFRLAFSKGPNRVGVSPFTWGRKHIQFRKRVL
jgi:hypothetical protein